MHFHFGAQKNLMVNIVCQKIQYKVNKNFCMDNLRNFHKFDMEMKVHFGNMCYKMWKHPNKVECHSGICIKRTK